MPGKILITGATGNIGTGLVAVLAARGADVRGLAHSEERTAAIEQSGAEAVVGDLARPESLPPAFAGTEVVVIITPGLEHQVELARNAINAAKQAGATRLVRLAAYVPEPALETVLGRQHHEINELVKSSGLAYTIVRPTFFMQNLLMAAPTVASDGAIYLPFGEGKAGIVDVRDIVDVIAEVATSEGHEGKTYTLTGRDSISIHDAAAALASVLGKPVNYVAVPVEAGLEAMMGMGVAPFVANTYGELFVNFANNGANRATGDVQQVTGHPARSIQDFANDFASMFAAAGAPA